MRDVELQEIIFQVLQARIMGKDQFAADFGEETILSLIKAAGKAFLSEPTVLQLNGLVKVVGDIHGNLPSLIHLFQSFGYPPETSYLFLGDYVDRGCSSTEVLVLLYAMKLLYPAHIYLLRGNHETPQLLHSSLFRNDCTAQVSKKAYSLFVQSFSALPIAAVVNGVFCVHGGLSPSLPLVETIAGIARPILRGRSPKSRPSTPSLSAIASIPRPTSSLAIFSPCKMLPCGGLKPKSKCLPGLSLSDPLAGSIQNFFSSALPKSDRMIVSVPSSASDQSQFSGEAQNYETLQNSSAPQKNYSNSFGKFLASEENSHNPNDVADLFWGDPSPRVEGFTDSPRGIGFLFGKDALELFLSENRLKGVIRGHAFCKTGYCWPLGADIPCLTVFSSSNYCGLSNPAAIAVVGTDGVIRPFLVPSPGPKERVIIPEWLLAVREFPIHMKEPEEVGLLFHCISV